MKDFYKVLRELGFKRMHRDKDTVTYERRFDNGVQVDVQIWADGKHRASNMHPSLSGPYAKMDSHPSGFQSIEGMRRAITFERSRWEFDVSKDFEPNFDDEGFLLRTVR